ncbi:MAG: glutamate racemase, partial [Clostridia bacterium]|nr:glutamate racemase [Clostridia bacterium]
MAERGGRALIGIFDSGLGGLTALRELVQLLPDRDIVYFGDTGRVPYGTRSSETIVRYAMQDMRFLLEQKVDVVLVACGTVSSTALSQLRAAFPIPVIGVVEGAAAAAVKATRNRRIGVIATGATVSSGAFPHAIAELAPDVAVTQVACPMLVPLVENGYIADDDPVTALVLADYLAAIRAAECDTLILGCTHFPLLAGAISRLLPGVKLINSGREAARHLVECLPAASADEQGTVRYFVSDS